MEPILMILKIWLVMGLTGYLIWRLILAIRESNLNKARHAANWAIQIYSLEHPEQAEAMKQIQEIYEEYLG